MERIFVVLDRFEIPGKGLALTGAIEDDSKQIHEGSTVMLKRPGLPDLLTVATGFELIRNCWSPHKPRNVVLLIPIEVGLENVPLKSEVWV
ncbi:hypothetical protein [Brevifollis gellanilyticus]|uniref:Uncharacterized protein n=1 Tax=Brevifollis gellanilyticus TaxID=748831 RepID=A0A512MH84_9BACT|nr:hypothetical protein [Brevifollis gellanilyticus]GEP46098.1 hypothetical protein BGE01nite_53890 [Brevifollis gellanilyticus]